MHAVRLIVVFLIVTALIVAIFYRLKANQTYSGRTKNEFRKVSSWALVCAALLALLFCLVISV